MDQSTYYTILGVSTTASLRDIKKAYRDLARQYHPDSHLGNRDAEAHFKLIATAATVLTDPDQRRAYDRQLATRPSPAAVNTDERRDGYDVQYDLTISRSEAAHGTQRALHFHAPDRAPYQIVVPVPAGSRAGTIIRLVGQGRPVLYGPGRGDCYVTIRIAEAFSLLRKLFLLTRRVRLLVREMGH